jgi:photosystem II stability/assembly factor-like uncharacterized protein
MHPSRSIVIALSLVLLTGAGCFGLGDSAPTQATGGLWISPDAGESWANKSVLPTAAGISSISGLDILSIEQDPSDASALYIGTKTSGMFYSLDGGESWLRPEYQDAMGGTVLDVQVDPRNVCTHYLLKSTRLYKTDTCGREYDNETYVETRTDESLTAMAIDWYDPDRVWLATSQGDILRSIDAGATWTAVHRANNTITDLEISSADSRVIFAGTRSRGVLRSIDGGATWVSLEDNLKPFSKADNVYDFAQSADGTRLYVSSPFGILLTEDKGDTWTEIPLITDSNEVTVRALAVSTTDPDTLYYGTSNAFYISTSNGSAWSTLNLPTTRAASVIRVDAEDGNKLYFGAITLED